MPLGINDLQAVFLGNNFVLQYCSAKIVNNNGLEGCFW
jgi:hypothetical protein